MQNPEILFVIPVRGGSKGIPRKNIKPLGGKPLMYYSIEYARLFAADENICISTDDPEIIEYANAINLNVPFVRSTELSNDTASTFAVLHDAVNFYKNQGKNYQQVVLLQATSPFREPKHFEEAIQLMDENTDVVASVTKEHNNPYFNVFEENGDGFLKISKGEGTYTRRQDCPPVYAFNGSIYIFNTSSLMVSSSFKDFQHIKKMEMDEKFKVDLDTMNDWNYCEYLLRETNSLVK